MNIGKLYYLIIRRRKFRFKIILAKISNVNYTNNWILIKFGTTRVVKMYM
jgi:hypothetical protein